MVLLPALGERRKMSYLEYFVIGLGVGVLSALLYYGVKERISNRKTKK